MRTPIDYDGLQVAFLGSALAHYLDLQTGEIIDLSFDAPAPDLQRYRRIPTRTAESESEDRRVFVGNLPPSSATRERLTRAIDDAMQFRGALSEDRAIEKRWFSFKNDRATAAVEVWLRDQGLV